jgi:D-serine deaminase-like pyridoxal phosphate-dependent protein
MNRSAEPTTDAGSRSALSVPALPADLATPCLVVDLDIVYRNIERLAAGARDRGVALRPHVKTHKSVALARMQLEAGAAVSLPAPSAKPEDGSRRHDDIFIAYLVWADYARADRLAACTGGDAVDRIESVEGAERLARAVEGTDRPPTVLVEIDSGGRRTGVADRPRSRGWPLLPLRGPARRRCLPRRPL